MKYLLPFCLVLIAAIVEVRSADKFLHFAADHHLVYRHGDCPGNDIVGMRRLSTEKCYDLCKATSNCVAFLWNEQNHCYIKHKTCLVIDTKNPQNHFFDKVHGGAFFRNAAVANHYSYRHGDCPGNDIVGMRVLGIEDCGDLCNANANCVAFLWNENNHCYIKRKSCAQVSTENPQNHFFDKAGAQLRFAGEHGLRYRHGDCPGNDIVGMRMLSTEKCYDLCKATSKCVAFLWNEQNHCYIKHKTCPVIDTKNPQNHFFDQVRSA